jgi:hypothetical protein
MSAIRSSGIDLERVKKSERKKEGGEEPDLPTRAVEFDQIMKLATLPNSPPEGA